MDAGLIHVRAVLVVLILAVAAFAGCAENPTQQNPDYSLNRQVRFHIDDANTQSSTQDPYQYVDAAIVVTITGDSPVVPSTLTLAYQDRSGNFVTKPITAFTTLTSLTKGTSIRVEDANITSGAELYANNVLVASRERPHVDWWNVNGYPFGFHMDPGAALTYNAKGGATQKLDLNDIKSNDVDVVLDHATASLGTTYDGKLDLNFGTDAQTIQAHASQTARPLAWNTTGTVGFPVTFEASGHNTTSGQAVTAGLEVLPATKVDYSAFGKLWWNASSSPVRMDVDGGHTDTSADVIAWETGVPEAGDFSCAGKTKADQCHPKEFDLDAAKKSEDVTPSKENLDTFPWDVDQSAVNNLTRVLDEDLRPGDELRFDIDLDSAKLGHPSTDTSSPDFHVVGSADLKALPYESVTVAAGTFQAIKVIEHVEMKLDTQAWKNADGTVAWKPISLDQKFVDTTFWLQKDTFVPLRVEQTSPIDLQQIVDIILNSASDDQWKQLAVEKLTDKNVGLSLEAHSSLELTHESGVTNMSPWAVLVGFHALAATPAYAIMGAMGAGMSQTAVSQPPGYPYEPPTTPAPGEYPRGHPNEPTPPSPEPSASLSLVSAAPLENGTKAYTIASASSGLSYDRLRLTLDGTDLDYGVGWCVIANGTCDEEAFANATNAGDTIQLMDVHAGQTLRVIDDWQNAVILTLTVG